MRTILPPPGPTLERTPQAFTFTCIHGVTVQLSLGQQGLTCTLGNAHFRHSAPSVHTLPLGDGYDVSSSVRRLVRAEHRHRGCANDLDLHIFREVGELYGRALATVDPVLDEMRRGMLRWMDSCGPVFQPWVPRDPLFARDVLTHAAAALALYHCTSLLTSRLGARPTPEAHTAALLNWRGLYSPDGNPYRSLDRTLPHLEEVPRELLTELPHVRLERPLRGAQLALLLACSRTARARGGGPLHARRLEVIQRTTPVDVGGALRRGGKYRRADLVATNPRDLEYLAVLIADDPRGNNTTSVEEITREAVRYHVRHGRYATRQPTRRYGIEALPAGEPMAPPIPLPSVEGLRFLATEQSILDEAKTMHHCVHSYRGRAAAGQCFIFHAERDGLPATIEVSAVGHVVQAVGPRNQLNATCDWARGELEAWGRTLVNAAVPATQVPVVAAVPTPMQVARLTPEARLAVFARLPIDLQLDMLRRLPRSVRKDKASYQQLFTCIMLGLEERRAG